MFWVFEGLAFITITVVAYERVRLNRNMLDLWTWSPEVDGKWFHDTFGRWVGFFSLPHTSGFRFRICISRVPIPPADRYQTAQTRIKSIRFARITSYIGERGNKWENREIRKHEIIPALGVFFFRSRFPLTAIVCLLCCAALSFSKITF